MNPLDILQRTPKSNCGQCGYPACLAFAANVARSGEDPKKCPYINLDGLTLEKAKVNRLDKLGEQHDIELIRHLRDKIIGLDFVSIAPGLGIAPPTGSEDSLVFPYLGQTVRLDRSGILLDGVEPEDPRDQILLYNYIFFQGKRPLTGEWVGLESLPNSISKVRTLATYCEDRLARLFCGKPVGTILDLASPLGGEALSSHAADAGLLIPVLPRLPQQLLFWDEDPEDGFEARVKILYDSTVLDYLDLESLVFSSERMADRIMALSPGSP